MIVAKFLKNENYSPQMIDDAINRGEITHICIEKDNVILFLNEEGIENEVGIMKSYLSDALIKSIGKECISEIDKIMSRANMKIIQTIQNEFKKYGLDFVSYVIRDDGEW